MWRLVVLVLVFAVAIRIHVIVRDYKAGRLHRPFDISVLRFLCFTRRFYNKEPPNLEAMEPLDRILYGTRLGDALGFGLENELPHQIPSTVNEYVFRRTGKFGVNCGPGSYSDDTAETIVVARNLERNNGTLTNLLDDLLRMYDDSRNWLGIARQGFGALKDVGDALDRPTAIIRMRANQLNSTRLPGNAPVMRSLPIGLFPNVLANAYANADATHPHPIARESSFAMALAANYVYSGHVGNLIIGSIRNRVPFGRVTDYLTTIDNLPYPLTNEVRLYLVGNPNSGCPVDSLHTLGVVLYLFKHTKVDDPWSSIIYALRLGGDVDTYMAPYVGLLSLARILQTKHIPEWAWRNLE